jgi:hypothetical protein
MDFWMDVMDDGGVLRAMDSFDFYCLLQGWGGLEYYPTNRQPRTVDIAQCYDSEIWYLVTF